MTARATGWRLRSGIWQPADVTDSYAVYSFPIQNDQSFIRWEINGDGSNPLAPARIVSTGDLMRSADGFYTFSWLMDYLTFGMLDYMLDTFLPGGVESAEVTAMTYDDLNAAQFVQCIIHRPRPGSGMQYAPAGWAAVNWQFERGVIVEGEET